MTLPVDSSSAPVMNAAGTAKTIADVRAFAPSPVCAVLVGSYTVEARPGNSGGTFFDGGSFALNSLGLPSPGLQELKPLVSETSRIARDFGKPLWASIAGFSVPEYLQLLSESVEAGADAIEINLGCPNVWDDGNQKSIWSYDLSAIKELAAAIDGLGPVPIPYGFKLSPVLDPVLMSAIHSLIRETDVSFLTAINTVPNAFEVSASGPPAIRSGAGLAGLSGEAVRPVALGQVKMHRDALPNLDIVGVGGISSGKDLRAFMNPLVGARLGQVGTALWRGGPPVFERLIQDFVDLDA